MSKKNILWLIFFNLFGAALFLSWYLPPMHGFWFSIDSGVFFFFNHLLARSDAFRYLVALTNLRPFDGVAFLAMLSIFGFHYRRADARGRRRMIRGLGKRSSNRTSSLGVQIIPAAGKSLKCTRSK